MMGVGVGGKGKGRTLSRRGAGAIGGGVWQRGGVGRGGTSRGGEACVRFPLEGVVGSWQLWHLHPIHARY